MNLPVVKPTVLLMGGTDMNLRLDLMEHLRSDFEMVCAGTVATYEQEFASAGFKYYPYPLGRTISPVKDLYSIAYLRRLFRKVRPHIVHTFDAKPGVWGRLTARWVNVPVIIGTIPGLGSVYTKNDFSMRLIRAIYEPLQRTASRFSDMTTFQNGDDARQFIAAGIVVKQKTSIIPGSGVPTEIYASCQVSDVARVKLRKDLNIKPDELVVTMISRVIRTKGVMEFVAAANQVKYCRPNTHFLLVGPDDQQSFDSLNPSEIAQLKQSVNWRGARRDIPTVLALSDVFVFPSAFREGIPRVLLEAASMGLPIITTNSPGCSEVVEEGVNGFLIPTHDSTALSQAILRLVDSSELRRRFGDASRQRAIENFDLNLIAERTRAMYRQLLTKRHILA